MRSGCARPCLNTQNGVQGEKDPTVERKREGWRGGWQNVKEGEQGGEESFTKCLSVSLSPEHFEKQIGDKEGEPCCRYVCVFVCSCIYVNVCQSVYVVFIYEKTIDDD